VALARALITQPRLLLLDEPLAAVDVSARGDTRRTLKAALHDFPGARILDTHDPLEAAALAGRIIVLETAPLSKPAPWPTSLPGPAPPGWPKWSASTLYRGWADGTSIHINANTNLTAATSGSGEVFAVIAPRAVTLHRHQPESSARNTWPGTESLDLEGDRVRVRITGSMPIVAEVNQAAVADLHLDEAGPIWVSVKATEVAVYPA
jgi:molybdate transport system ATP-binding protein